MAGGDNIRRGEEHLAEVLRSNGYPDHVIRSAVRVREGREANTQYAYRMCQGLVKTSGGCVEDTTSGLCLQPSLRCDNN